MNSFYITLISDSSLDIYPNNTLHNFITKLPKHININKNNWEAALVEIIYPSQIININEHDTEFYITSYDQVLSKILANDKNDYIYKNNMGTIKCTINPGVYSNGKHVINEINKAIQRKIKIIFGNDITFEVLYSPASDRPKLNYIINNKILKGNLGILFSDTLYQKLGGTDNNHVFLPFEPILKSFPFTINLNSNSDKMFIYSDIIEYNLLGNLEAPILRIVPLNKGSTANQVHKEFVHKHYLPIAKSSFDEIKIVIRGETGIPIYFASGKTILKLHFKEKNKFIL